jgi:site-specific DNA-methyltransferase (adenine-specific)
MKINDYIEITNENNLDLMKRYSDKYFDLAIVDPPYGIGISKDSIRHMHKKKIGIMKYQANNILMNYFE